MKQQALVLASACLLLTNLTGCSADPRDAEIKKMIAHLEEAGQDVTNITEAIKEAVKKGSLIGFPVTGVRCVINDGLHHAVDSSEQAFKTAALMGFREGYEAAKPVILEPIMNVEVQAPEEFQGQVVGQLNQRRGVIQSTETVEGYLVATAHIPLSEMFGYSTDLRSATQGKGEFSMEFAKYQPVPRATQEQMIKEFREKQAAAKK